jgi:CoA:oxalate CoA-transferase
MTGPGPLDGVTVVDCTRILSGPYATMMLADLGARVIKVERPGTGDDARSFGPFTEHGSAYFASINRGKDSVALDLKEPADRERFEVLLTTADVLAENFRPGTLERLGYGWDALRARWPRLVLLSVSGFGQTGPMRDRPAYDMVVQALGGLMSITGPDGGPATRVGTSIGDIAAGMFGAYGTVSALYQRERTGEGAHVDVSMLDSQVALLENAVMRYQASGEVPGPIGSRHPSIAPFATFATATQPIVIAAGSDELWAVTRGALGLDDDPRFATNADRCAHEPALRAAIEGALAAEAAETWLVRLGEAGVPCAPVQDVAQVLRDPQVLARNMVVPLTGAWAGFVVPGNPVKLSTHDQPRSFDPPPDLPG